jgi:hypothetical protein
MGATPKEKERDHAGTIARILVKKGTSRYLV